MTQLSSIPKKLWKTYGSNIQSINNLEDELKTLSQNELKQKFNALLKNFSIFNFKSRLLTEDDIITSFAITREVSRRVLRLRHYDVQLLGGLILNEGKIIEMQTGEGKTLVATLPAVANAITKNGVHVITVNDYLAQRDTEWIGQIYNFLGLSVGLVHDNLSVWEKKDNYNTDITYLTNTVLGFDFLKDNLATGTHTLVQRPFNFCIIDEIDSVLIDEAKTPLVISQPEPTNVKKFFKATQVIQYLEKINDFEIDEKLKSISLTERGFRKIKILLDVDDLHEIRKKGKNKNTFQTLLEQGIDYGWIYYILNALKAKYLYFENTDYVVTNKEVIIVDESTGRLMPGRRWGEGLHEAIEIKEGLTEIAGSQNIASINYQSLFRFYEKLSGMSGTAKTDEIEFKESYNLSVSIIPPFKPLKREDLPDLIYSNDTSRWNAICQDVKKLQGNGRPILIGTPTIKSSDILSNLFKLNKIPHEVLNARPENLKRESEIIAKAGRKGSVTIATNMAGRGTDILLGGNPEFQAKIKLKEVFNRFNPNNSKNFINEIKSNKFYIKIIGLLERWQIEKSILILTDKFTNKNDFNKNSTLEDIRLEKLLKSIVLKDITLGKVLTNIVLKSIVLKDITLKELLKDITLEEIELLDDIVLKDIKLKELFNDIILKDTTLKEINDIEDITLKGFYGLKTLENIELLEKDIVNIPLEDINDIRNIRSEAIQAIKPLKLLAKSGLLEDIEHPLKDIKQIVILQFLISIFINDYLLEIEEVCKNFDGFFDFLLGPKKKFKKFDEFVFMFYKILKRKYKKISEKEANLVKNLGGLYVIGTERHSSRRIDNQLRGRAGRQGDPGTSRFYLSANDRLIRVFGGDQLDQFFKLFKSKTQAFENKFFSKFITSAQQKIESMNYEQRQNLTKYEQLLEKQHLFILKIRQAILKADNLSFFTNSLMEQLIDELIDEIKLINTTNNNNNRFFKLSPNFYLFLNLFNINISSFFPRIKNINNLKVVLLQQTWAFYNKTESDFWSYDPNLFSGIQKLIYLKKIDFYWIQHLENMNFIKESIGWQGYGQRDPLLMYLEKSEYLFKISLKNIRNMCLLEIFSLEIIPNS